MAGVKGKSGRKSRFAEIKVAELADLSVNWAIENWATLESQDKLKILTALAPKAIPVAMEHSFYDDQISKIVFERVSREKE